jgi:hypothetical protein
LKNKGTEARKQIGYKREKKRIKCDGKKRNIGSVRRIFSTKS